MSALTEKREEYSSNIVRILHPSHATSQSSNIKDMDSELDYLLDDLQSSVGAKHRGQLRENVQYYDPTNTTIVVREKSLLPAKSEGKQSYKVTSYQYKTDHLSTEPGKNVNQLDNLLEDLKSERDVTKERDYGALADPKRNIEFIDSPQNFGKTTHVYRTITREEKPRVQRELVYGSTTRNVQENILDSPNYVHGSNTSYEQSNESDLKLQNVHNTVVLDNTAISDDLKNVPLSDDILPVPGTKVTTTVRTYTYEIPAEPSSLTTKTLLYKNDSYSRGTSPYPQRSVPSKIVIETESQKMIDKIDANYPIDKPQTQLTPSPGKTKILYQYDGTNIRGDNTDVIYYPSNDNKYPPGHSTPIKPQGPTTAYYYKHESSVNTTYGPNAIPNDKPNEPHIVGPPHEPYIVGPPHDSPNYTLERPTRPLHITPSQKDTYPPNPPDHITDINHRHTSRTTTINTHIKSVEKEPLLQPAPFPVDDFDGPRLKDGSNAPKHIDDLMASFNGNVERGPVTVSEIDRKKEIETCVAAPGEPRIPSKNITGPPVYYPPGHELFVRKEEGGGMYRAQGGYAKASGRYEYEAESKSKSKTRSGAAVVPVCLPLCCAMPCTIM